MVAKTDHQMHDFVDFSGALCTREVQFCAGKLPTLANRPRTTEYLHVFRRLSAPKPDICYKIYQTKSLFNRLIAV